MPEIRFACFMAVRFQSEREATSTWLPEPFYERAMVHHWGHLDLAKPHVFRHYLLHHHHRHSFRKDAFPTGKTGPFALWQRGHLVQQNHLISEQMQATTFLGEVAVHLFDETTLTEDDNTVARLQLSVTIDKRSLVLATNVAAKRHT